eukprot:CAMPEP_0170620714 /NCGR_PEP_ID=MMETSP0224-20130122/28204_1 /TAXON_ID=285029 /ORGANISM="Togula jolla, Strain CCCM 725" /LENGTH=253 /DNA_ID=CAMNT_0010946903 /DNA_START=84 /DNA_END=845 /DNA_ORIENTATION=+
MAQNLQLLLTNLILVSLLGRSTGRQLLRKENLPRGAMIFLHGWGDNGIMDERLVSTSDGEFMERLEQAGVELLIPDAPERELPPPWGPTAPAWFDVTGALTLDAPEQTASAKESYEQIVVPLLDKYESTIGLDKVIIGGYSMGAEFALQMLNFAPKNIAGIFCMSGYLKDDSGVWEALETGNSFPPVWMGHGTVDDSVAFENGKATYDRLLTKGITAQFHPVEDMSHDMSKEELSDVVTWSLQQLGIDEESSS